MRFYERGKEYGDVTIRFPLVRIHFATQKNISGTYTKEIKLPGFWFGRSYRGAQLKLFGITVFNINHPGGVRSE